MQKLCISKLKLATLILPLLLFSCVTDHAKERKYIQFTRSISIDGVSTLEWSISPLYINNELYQPNTEQKLKKELYELLDKKFLKELFVYSEERGEQFAKIQSCLVLSKKVDVFADNFGKYMQKTHPRNWEYDIFAIYWVNDHFKNLSKIKKNNLQCKDKNKLSNISYLFYLIANLESKHKVPDGANSLPLRTKKYES